ncbi:ABC transporter permease [Hoyosella rhizosphaerae]|uniref:Iron ABC transporter permease n=1 Tax=Hoyosella rhizosphaerae TaxID=1755582 RepID=A0A916XEC6_9ACTN|nr:iron chelate uptake ABC transporter family permease subunit [Hoyosella rhizosphaerae]GGC67720.1 iron ABC transporter permease [Hoyosella rhizosphaerae]
MTSRAVRTSLLPLAFVALIVLALVSIFIGVTAISPIDVITGRADDGAVLTLIVSRLPRTLAVILAGAALAVAGLLMQLLARNRFVEPSTVGTVESAGLGLLAVTILAPAVSVFGKMLVATVFALAGTALFLLLIRNVRQRDSVHVPLIGIMLSGIIGAVATFIAYRHDLLQTLASWTVGNFSSVLQGRYELLYLVAILTGIAMLAADRFTVAGLGAEFTTNLGLNYRRVLAFGMGIIAVISAVVVTVVGAIPFLGLVVPNIVSMIVGDSARRGIPWVAVAGAGFALSCDIIGRTVRYPYEIPVGTVAGVIGAAIFLYLLLRRNSRVH